MTTYRPEPAGLDKLSITAKTLVTAAVGDHVLIADLSDSSNLKKVTVQTIVDIASEGNAATVTTNANLTGHVTSVGNAAVLGSFTKAQLDAAVSDDNVAYVGQSQTFVGNQVITGNLTASGTLALGPTSGSGPTISSNNLASNSIIVNGGAGNMALHVVGSLGTVVCGSGRLGFGDSHYVSWHGNSDGTGAGDTRLSRNAANVLQIGTTANNALGSLLLTNLTATGTVLANAFTTVVSGYTTERFGKGAAPSATAANTVVGQEAGEALTTGSGNVFVGLQAGSTTSTGNQNTIIGHQARCGNSTGVIGIGFQVVVSSGLTTPIAIGNATTAAHNDAICIGTFAATSKSSQLTTGTRIQFWSMQNDSSTVSRHVCEIKRDWIDSTDATRKGRMSLWAYDAGGVREGIRIDSNGTSAQVGIGGAVSGTAALTVTGNLIASGTATLGIYTVATLPSASSNPYAEANVSDALTPAMGSTVAGGGAVKTKVRSNGTDWTVSGI